MLFIINHLLPADKSVDSGPCISTGDTEELKKYKVLQDLLRNEGQDSIKLPPGMPFFKSLIMFSWAIYTDIQ